MSGVRLAARELPGTGEVPRLLCSRPGIEPGNDDTHTAATISIDGLF